MKPVANILFYIDKDLDKDIRVTWNDHLYERAQTNGRLLNNYAESRIADERTLESIILDTLSLPLRFLKEPDPNSIIDTITYRSLDKLIDIRNHLDHITVATKVDKDLDLHSKERKLLNIERGINRLNFYIEAIRNKQFEVFSIDKIRFEDDLPYFDKRLYTPNKIAHEPEKENKEEETGHKIDLPYVFKRLEKLLNSSTKLNESFSQRQINLFYFFMEKAYSLPSMKIHPTANKLAVLFGHKSGKAIYNMHGKVILDFHKDKEMTNKRIKDLEYAKKLLESFPAANSLIDQYIREKNVQLGH